MLGCRGAAAHTIIIIIVIRKQVILRSRRTIVIVGSGDRRFVQSPVDRGGRRYPRWISSFSPSRRLRW